MIDRALESGLPNSVDEAIANAIRISFAPNGATDGEIQEAAVQEVFRCQQTDQMFVSAAARNRTAAEMVP